jgi:hypothetical protein
LTILYLFLTLKILLIAINVKIAYKLVNFILTLPL